MAKKNGKVSINKIESLVNKWTSDVVLYDDVVVTVRKNISFTEQVKMIDDIVHIVTDGEYMAASYDYALRKNVVLYFTNITLPDNVDRAFDILFCTDIYDKIIDHIDREQLMSIESAALEQISYVNDTQKSYLMQRIDDLAMNVSRIIDELEPILTDPKVISSLVNLNTVNLNERDLLDYVMKK